VAGHWLTADSLIAVNITRRLYRYAYHRSSWVAAGNADPSPLTRLHRHPDSPFSGHQLASGAVVSFEKLKLTNNAVDHKPGHVSWPLPIPIYSQFTPPDPTRLDETVYSNTNSNLFASTKYKRKGRKNKQTVQRNQRDKLGVLAWTQKAERLL